MKCPICKKSSVDAFKPFCSKHCADVDLHGWFNDKYGIASEEEPEEAELEQLITLLEEGNPSIH